MRPAPVRPAASRPGSDPLIARPGAKPNIPGLNRRKPEGDPFLGQVLNGRFKIESKLGEGGFGAVYRGTQVQTGRKVALKLLHPEMTRDENLVARFRREGLVLCNLQDPHTITTYDFDSTPEGTLYIAMELLEGKSLHTVFHNEAPIEWRRVLKILSQMCSSLGEAHRQGIVHRDLKPENIYLENRGGDLEFVKILDFGIAKVMRGDNSVDPQAPQLTATGQTLGTLEYMSPEQLMGKQLDGRSDVYALGVLGYELLTGRLPFPEAKGPAALITAQLKQTPKPPSTVNANGDIPPGVDRIIGKMLEKDKNARFADVGALAAAAQECLATGRWGEPAAPAPPPGPPVAEPLRAPPASNPMRQNPMMHVQPSASGHLPMTAGGSQPDLHGLPTMPPDRGSPRGQFGPPPGMQQHGHGMPPSNPGMYPAGSMQQPGMQQPPPYYPELARSAPASNLKFVWIIVALIAIGAGVGVTLAFVL